MSDHLAVKHAGLLYGGVVLGSLLLAGCGSKDSGSGNAALPDAPKPAVITAANQKTLVPLKVGNTWTYDIQLSIRRGGKTGGHAAGNVTMTVTHAETNGDETKGVIEATGKKGVVDRQHWVVNSSGIYVTAKGLNAIPYSPMQPVMLFPIDKNQSFTWSGTGPIGTSEHGEIKDSIEVNLAPQISTATSTVSGVSVRSVEDFNSSKGPVHQESTEYFQPGVGLVRVLQTAKVKNQVTQLVMRLSSTNVK